jgi:opacity protein-like surface antigen
MKTLLAAAAIATVALSGPVLAQTYQPMNPAQPQPMQPTYTSGTMGAPSWMTDDGSSSDHPIHNRGDRSGDALNSQYNGGLTVPAGQGLPGYPGQR